MNSKEWKTNALCADLCRAMETAIYLLEVETDADRAIKTLNEALDCAAEKEF
jgi:hypothetical protein